MCLAASLPLVLSGRGWLGAGEACKGRLAIAGPDRGKGAMGGGGWKGTVSGHANGKWEMGNGSWGALPVARTRDFSPLRA